MATENDDLYAQLISSSLDDIRQNYSGPWYLPRTVASQPGHSLPQKRKTRNPLPDAESVRDDLLHQLSSDAPSYTFSWRHVNDEQYEGEPLRETSPWPKYLNNWSDVTRDLELSSTSMQKPASFHVPPGAAWYLGDCSSSRSFHMAVKDVAEQLDTPRQFDVIVMDPPWPNASVRRTEKSGRAAYQVSPTVWDIRQLIFEMDIDVLLANEGVIAIWITNKPAVQDLVLGEDGLFDSWDVQLEEEWLWIKTTTEGEPVSSLDALWRKPYEVLLVGRKHDPRRSDQHVNLTHGSKVERRVIVGLADLHSRKPCLKPLFERFAISQTSTSTKQRILECFARHLVAGWWSWGNQVLKFNHTDYLAKHKSRIDSKSVIPVTRYGPQYEHTRFLLEPTFFTTSRLLNILAKL
ncbi:MT-A70-domain-containing protein [Aureobasidium sp. EXF-3400]|nr:MT-A70-domain-containing protein [Aureobasidium sp. EXF-12344]KAI4778266.1 MT-A70-domain-containing protein [Aureobasidium sp. EXF-3400]